MKINKLTVYSSRIKKLLKFYRDELGFEIREYAEKSFELKLGYSVLRFEYREHATPYHIALHVPDRQEEEVLQWVETNLGALKNNEEKIIDFSNWHAKSVYFYDADRNIMEFISRRDFSKPESAIFEPVNIVGIAEIGLATDDVEQKFRKMKEEIGLQKFDGDLERFCAIGNPEGLVITINKDLKDWFPTGDRAYMSAFKVEIEHEDKQFALKFDKNKLDISKI
ncbi:VOC family protein [Gramella sp. GC03-9]|uniref:VOC family protein n=1 Tax=Christiangramia oceanisediminis TaxID=2920386 RepID=A0A9X2KW12_9FLAO|nr:VOC family protein [Gramella oceanisediminis]MCP9199737.1 VOC family protein [Gramella oceanisediminis]